MPHFFSIVITGEWPGAGQSTTTKILASKLGFERVYAGFLQRKFAQIWHQEKTRMSWQKFEKLFENQEIKIDDFEFSESDFTEAAIQEWTMQLKRVKIPEFWDKQVDQASVAALRKPGVVVEAKVGVLLDKTGLPSSNLATDFPIYKILLTCPAEIAAHRAIQRTVENGELPPMQQDTDAYQELVRTTTRQIISRQLKDWERYETLYHIRRSDIYNPNIFQVSSSHKEPQLVADEILYLISANSVPEK